MSDDKLPTLTVFDGEKNHTLARKLSANAPMDSFATKQLITPDGVTELRTKGGNPQVTYTPTPEEVLDPPWIEKDYGLRTYFPDSAYGTGYPTIPMFLKKIILVHDDTPIEFAPVPAITAGGGAFVDDEWYSFEEMYTSDGIFPFWVPFPKKALYGFSPNQQELLFLGAESYFLRSPTLVAGHDAQGFYARIPVGVMVVQLAGTTRKRRVQLKAPYWDAVTSRSENAP